MRGRTLLLILVVASASQTRLEASCIEPAQLAHSSVSITRYFDEGERAAAKPGVVGTSGTAWFLSPTTLVTAEHVSAAMMLATQEWKPLDIKDGDDVRSI